MENGRKFAGGGGLVLCPLMCHSLSISMGGFIPSHWGLRGVDRGVGVGEARDPKERREQKL